MISFLQTCTDKLLNNGNDEDLSWNVWFFFLAQLLHGAGAAPLFTLGVTFIDENVSKKMSSVYLGMWIVFYFGFHTAPLDTETIHHSILLFPNG